MRATTGSLVISRFAGGGVKGCADVLLMRNGVCVCVCTYIVCARCVARAGTHMAPFSLCITRGRKRGKEENVWVYRGKNCDGVCIRVSRAPSSARWWSKRY